MVEFSFQICAFLVKKEMVETAVSAGHGGMCAVRNNSFADTEPELQNE